MIMGLDRGVRAAGNDGKTAVIELPGALPIR
jgi:hypothetical protein